MILNVLPMITIIVSNAGIVVAIFAQKRKLRKVHALSEPANTFREKKMKPLAKILFLISVFFICTTLPYTVFMAVKVNIDGSTPLARARRNLVESILLFILYTNFTVNFFFYFMAGTLFKTEWKRLCAEILDKIGWFKGIVNIPETELNTSRRPVALTNA